MYIFCNNLGLLRGVIACYCHFVFCFISIQSLLKAIMNFLKTSWCCLCWNGIVECLCLSSYIYLMNEYLIELQDFCKRHILFQLWKNNQPSLQRLLNFLQNYWWFRNWRCWSCCITCDVICEFREKANEVIKVLRDDVWRHAICLPTQG